MTNDTKRLTLAKVNAAIKGTGLRARRDPSGYYYWEAITPEAEKWVDSAPSVYVFAAHQLTLQQWVDEANSAAKVAKAA